MRLCLCASRARGRLPRCFWRHPCCSRPRVPWPLPIPSSCASGRPRTSIRSTRTTRRSSSGTRSSASTTTCSSASARTSSPSPGFAESWSRAADGNLDVQDPPGHEVVGRHARDRRGRLLLLPDHPRRDRGRHNVGLGYIDPAVTDAGVTKVECPDDPTMIVTTTDPSDRSSRSTSRSCPSTSGGQDATRPIADDPFDAPIVGTGPYQVVEWKTGEYVRFERNPNYWGTQGAADEIIIQFFTTRDTMVQALKAGEIDYARELNADQFDAAQDRARHRDGRRRHERLDRARVQHLRHRHRQDHRGRRRRRPRPSRTRPSATPSATPIDKQMLLDHVLQGYGDVGTTQVPPVADEVARRAGQAADVRHRARQAEARRGRLRPRRVRQPARQGRQADQPPALLPELDDNYPKIRASSSPDWFGAARHQGGHPVFDAAHAHGPACSRRRPATSNKADYDMFIWGWTGDPDPNALLQIFTLDAIGSSAQPLVDPELRRAVRRAARRPDAERAQGDPWPRCSRPGLRPGAVPHPRTTTTSLHAYRTDKFAGWQNQPAERHAALRLRHARLHAADERGSDGHAVARAVGRGPVRGGVRAPTAAPRPTPAPAATASGGDSHAPCSSRAGRGRRRSSAAWSSRAAASGSDRGRVTARPSGPVDGAIGRAADAVLPA